MTALAWVIAAVTGHSEQAALALGFIPAAAERRRRAVARGRRPILTPLTRDPGPFGLIHLGFNLLMFVWCGTAVERVLGKTGLSSCISSALMPQRSRNGRWTRRATVPMVGASGAISAVIGAFALSFGRAKTFTAISGVNRWINVVWLLVAWVVLQLMMGWLAGGQGYLLATPAHVGGFAAGLLLQRPLLLWRYRKALASPAASVVRFRDAPSMSGSSRRWRWTTTYFISASSTCAAPRRARRPRRRRNCRRCRRPRSCPGRNRGRADP